MVEMVIYKALKYPRTKQEMTQQYGLIRKTLMSVLVYCMDSIDMAEKKQSRADIWPN